ncbi:MAG: phosphoglucosamine mutase [Gemmataceae bacterium]
MSNLIVSVSGVRGIVGDGLTPDVAMRFAAALGIHLGGGRVVLSRDSRPSGAMLRHAAIAGLTATGCNVLDIGIAPTPTVGVVVREFAAAGGLQITASHNPAPWNGLKLFGSDGAVLTAAEGERIKAIYDAGKLRFAGWDGIGRASDDRDASRRHLDRVLALTDVSRVRARNASVLLDANGGAGGPLGVALLESLGCAVTPLACEPDGHFRHEAEPVPAHLTTVEAEVRKKPGTFGAVLDPDADRLALIDERGRCLSEELTLALAVQYRLMHERGPVVVNMSSSRVTADLAERAGASFFRSAVGEANVVAKMREVGALVGGEGNGGVIDPRVGWVRDPFIGLALILSLMAETGRTLSELADALPQYHIRKDKSPVPRDRLAAALDALAKRWPEARSDRIDGLRLDWPDRWLHVRGSNTEPVVRAIAEAPTADDAAELCRQAGAILASA